MQGLVTPVMLSCSDGMHDSMKPSCLPASSIAAAISHSHIRNHLHVFAMHTLETIVMIPVPTCEGLVLRLQEPQLKTWTAR